MGADTFSQLTGAGPLRSEVQAVRESMEPFGRKLSDNRLGHDCPMRSAVRV